jgi:hypothetical protein
MSDAVVAPLLVIVWVIGEIERVGHIEPCAKAPVVSMQQK